MDVLGGYTRRIIVQRQRELYWLIQNGLQIHGKEYTSRFKISKVKKVKHKQLSHVSRITSVNSSFNMAFHAIEREGLCVAEVYANTDFWKDMSKDGKSDFGLLESNETSVYPYFKVKGYCWYAPAYIEDYFSQDITYLISEFDKNNKVVVCQLYH